MTTKKYTRVPNVIKITGVSYEDVINIHFGTSSTVVDDNQRSTPLNKIPSVSIVENTDKSDKENEVYSRHKPEYFLDSKKHRVTLWPSMIDTHSNGMLPLYTNKPCRNCHHPYTTHPIGCPIKYHPHTEGVSETRAMVEEFLRNNNFSSKTMDYFETERMFCSLPCVKSYIISCLSKHPLSNKYGNCLTYLSLMYRKMNNTDKVTIIPEAHPIETLTAYDGHLSIEDYRSSFGTLRFDETISTKRPLMFASFSYMEEIKVT